MDSLSGRRRLSDPVESAGCRWRGSGGGQDARVASGSFARRPDDRLPLSGLGFEQVGYWDCFIPGRSARDAVRLPADGVVEIRPLVA